MTRWARLWRRTTRLFGVDAVPVTVVDDMAPDPSGWSDTRVSPAVAERIAVLARDAQPWERQQAATDLAATGDSSIAGLLPTR